MLKKIDPILSSVRLDKLIATIQEQATRNGIQVVQYSLADLDNDLLTGKKQTKDNIAAEVADRHPELKNEYQRERNNRREYHAKMFEAIAVAERYRN